ncbi:MAG: ribose 5-phosphate isomerase B [Phycisphaerales bacterium]|nr:ribose 5-phosphate isomerase B [Phycisphaerales bacterium]
MKIVLGCDHRGAAAVRGLLPHLRAHGHQADILGPCEGSACDYPDGAYRVASAVAGHDADLGILICGSGIGMSIAANKVDGIRAALVCDEITAKLARRHNDANVLCLSADMSGPDDIAQTVDAWLETEFEGGRHARRLRKVAAIEAGQDPSTVTADEGTTATS